MRIWITKGCKTAAALGLFVAMVCPAIAMAAVQFTEVMYDAPGADTGREWLEVTNTGSDTVDLTGYKLFESDVNHGLTVTQGSSTLAAGQSAIIASNVQKFLADYPAYAGTLFKSSFSLTNTGESVSLKDKTLDVVDSVTYSSGMGAGGDGNSLHFSGAGWIPGAPNPGSSAPTKAMVKAAPISAAASQTSAKASAGKKVSKASSQNTFNAQGTSDAAAIGMAPLLQNIPSVYLYALGLGALIILGVGAVLYVKPLVPAQAVTHGEGEEFELE